MDFKKALVEASSCEGTEDMENVLLNEGNEVLSIIEAFDFMSNSELSQFFVKMSGLASDVAEMLCDEEEEQPESQNIENVNKLKRISLITLRYMESSKVVPVGLLDTVQVLHDVLIPLDDATQGVLSLKVTIARICEKCWVRNIEGAANLVTQLIPYLLIAALSPAAHDADVKRLHNIRTSLLLLDFDDETIESIRSLILRCFIHPAFLRVAEGRKFLSFLFLVHEGLNSMILEVMKPQIAAGSRGVPPAYGEVLFRAWKDTPGEGEAGAVSLESIEEGLQGLFHDAIHAADPKYFKGLRIVLRSFHEAKRLKGVDSLLLRIYGPILWRSLRCANALVRAQATMVFFDAFPLQGSDSSAVESDAILQKQFDLLSSLLKDTDHRVRAAAASGVCHILREYWEALPSQTTRQILSHVVATLGHDSSCATVRLAVITGLGEILDQPLSHTVLQGLLPLIADALHDKSLAVRVAFVGVLNKVKNTRGIHFCQIVSVDKLQRQLAEDINRPALCKAMTQLLLNSYYPQASESQLSKEIINQNQVQRCLQFVKENIVASVAFYGTFYQYTSVGSAAKLVVMLSALFTKESNFEHLIKSGSITPTSMPPPKGKRDRANKVAEEIPETEDNSTINVVSVGVFKVAVLRVMLAILKSIAKKLPEDSGSTNLLLKYFAPESVRGKFELLSAQRENEGENEEEGFDGEENEGVTQQLVPLFLQIVAIVWKSRGNADVITNGLDSNVILSEYIKTWQLKSKQSTSKEDKIEASVTSNAVATIEILRALNSEDYLYQQITEPFTALLTVVQSTTQPASFSSFEICNSPEPSMLNARGKRKPKNGSSPGMIREPLLMPLSCIPAAAALELLSVINNDSNEGGNNKNKDKVFTTVRNILTTILSSPTKSNELFLALDGSETQDSGISGFKVPDVLVQCVHLWAVSAVQSAVIEKAQNVRNNGESLRDLITWVKDTILPTITPSNPTSGVSDLSSFQSPGVKCPPRSRVRQGTPMPTKNKDAHDLRAVELAVRTFKAVLLVLSDALVMRVGVEDMMSFFDFTVEMLSSDVDDDVLSSLQPVLIRLSGLLSQIGRNEEKMGEKINNLYNIIGEENENITPDNEENEENEENENQKNRNENRDDNYNSSLTSPSPLAKNDTKNYKKLIFSDERRPEKNMVETLIEDEFHRLSL